MANMYIREQGAVVRKRGERLLVTKEENDLEEVPLIHIDQLVLVGNVQLTTPAASVLLKHEVDVVFLTKYYKFRGRLIQTGSKFAQLRHEQLRTMSDDPASLDIARAIVVGKITNQRTIIQRQSANVTAGHARGELRASFRGMKAMLDDAERAATLESLRGYEGKAGAYYFRGFRAILQQDLGFQKREYYPPPDPVNSLLSFGYSLLLKDVTAAIQLVGLDPYLGFFHAIDYGRPSLALDVMEEFRPIIVDPMVLGLVNQHRLTDDDFERTNNPKRPVQLSDAGCDLLLREYEERITTRIYHPLAKGKTSYRRVFELQTRRLARVILGKTEKYQPMTIR